MGMSRRKEKGNPSSTCVWTSGTSRDRMSLSSEWHGQGLKGLAARNGTADLDNDDLLDPVVDGQNYLITTNHATTMSMVNYPLSHWVRVRMLPGPSHRLGNSYQPGANDPHPGTNGCQLKICGCLGPGTEPCRAHHRKSMYSIQTFVDLSEIPLKRATDAPIHGISTYTSASHM